MIHIKNFNIKTSYCKVIKAAVYCLTTCLLIIFCVSCSCLNPKSATSITGYIYDASYPIGQNVPVANACVKLNNHITYSDKDGNFILNINKITDPLLKIIANEFHPYTEKYSRTKDGGFYLIPSYLYQDFKLLTWGWTPNNLQNWHRKWARQPEIFIIKAQANDQQISFLVNSLKENNLPLLTGGVISFPHKNYSLR